MAILDPSEVLFTAFEPKVANRFIMYIDGIPSYFIYKVSGPGFDAGEIIVDHINVYRKTKGKIKWDDMTLELYDAITPSAQQSVMEWARLAHESVTGRDGYSDFYKKDLKLELIGPPGDIVGEWVIKGAFVKTAKFGDYAWDGGDQKVILNLTIAMDYCILNF